MMLPNSNLNQISKMCGTRLLLLFISIIVAVIQINDVTGEEAAAITSNPCIAKATCGECIVTNPQCAWCKQDGYGDKGDYRCDFHSNLLPKCPKAHIVSPAHEFQKIKDKALSVPGGDIEDIVQIAPQEIRLKLRPNDPFQLNLKFRQSEDYPVDLYYLMDLSKSMQDDKDKLAELGSLIADRMGKITRDFHLGFGSFVDKVVMPYVSTVPDKLIEPCTGCAAPYGFKNHMTLSRKTDMFREEVKSANVSGNLDAPEGGFDAIMQSMVCHKEIGWRDKSRKMLVFSTDAGFHYAGDGKLGGIVQPNDGRCHMDSRGYYTESSNQDYPSVSQVNQKIIEKKVNIIFAVTSSQLPIYEQLSNNLEGASAGRLENDSSNVVELVRDQYDKITSEVEIKDNATSNIRVTYYSKCLGNRTIETRVCSGLKVGTTVEFQAKIEVLSCPKDPKEWKQTFHIYPVGFTESLVVHLESICECDCERPEKEEKSSPSCGGFGTHECGICSCYGNRFGRKCECDNVNVDKDLNDFGCRQDNSTILCSGRGQCICGLCDCLSRDNADEKVYGQFCECDNFSCDRYNSQICSGPDHGTCECGTCQCKSQWQGKACECWSGTEKCYPPNGNGDICSGNGECECGVCKCRETEEGRFSGPFCEECPTCAGKCALYRPCVQCQVFLTGELTEEQCAQCTFNSTPVDEPKVERPSDRLCVFKDDDDCKFTFVYGYDEFGQPDVRVQRTKDCPPPVNILMIVLLVILGIVLIGLALLLIWKLLTTIHDRREFAKFEKERQMAKWDTGENPIFKQATSTFSNPTYGGKN